MGRAKPAPYPHIFPSITATPREPKFCCAFQQFSVLHYYRNFLGGVGGFAAHTPPAPQVVEMIRCVYQLGEYETTISFQE